MKIEKWNDVHGNTTPDEPMVAFLESSIDSYAVLQLKRMVSSPFMLVNARTPRFFSRS